MKQRFSALDVRATVANLRERLSGLRLQNVYDINSKTFLLKFAKPDRKELILIESGIRIHTTQFAREKAATPSSFCMKIRKHLRTRRLTSVRQLGSDRIVDFDFGGGESGQGYHIIAEFYASGNIILTDQDFRILSLLRVVQPSENVRMAVGELYNTETVARDFQEITATRLQEVLKKAGPKDVLKKFLNSSFDYGPALSEHTIIHAGLYPNLKIATEFDVSSDSPQFIALLDSLKIADNMILECGKNVQKGYIILLQHSKTTGEEDPDTLVTYDEFHPFLYDQHTSKPFKEFATFDAAVDEFFSAIESQKIDLKSRQQEEAAIKKLEAVRNEQEKRIKALESLQLSNERKAQLIELNLQMVDAAILIIRNAIASSMDWKELGDLVANEKRKDNPIARMIDSLKLETNQLALRLSDPTESENESDLFDSSDEEETTISANITEPQVWIVDVDIYLTAFANARKYYEQKKQSAMKQDKTVAASAKAYKSAERKIRQDLKETKITATINKIRKPFWFEKFLWFVSTENYLVIAGRDMQQNELLVKRHFGKDDIYVHADLHGAASVIVKNSISGEPIPPSTLYQAGIMSVCQSKAWDAKIITSAYWVTHEQVSKTAPTGEYLTTGSFMIRGKKNYLPPVQLVYGFGYLFKMDDSCIGNHIHERRTLRLEEEISQDKEATQGIQTLVDASGQTSEPILEGQDAEVDNEQEDFTELNDEDDDDNDENSDSPKAQEETEGQNNAAQESSRQEEQDSSASESEDDSKSDEDAFPDTQVATTANVLNKLSTWDKYNLQELGDSAEEDDGGMVADSDTKNNENTQSKKYLSAKERRELKKKKEGNAGGGEETADQEERADSPKTGSAKDKDKKPASPQLTRGKKGKIKKMKDKYAEQDDEERELRMELLGSAKGPQPKGKKGKKEAERKEQLKTRGKNKLEVKPKNAVPKQTPIADQLMEGSNTSEQREASVGDAHDEERDEVDLLDNEKDDDEVRQLLKEENVAIVEGEDAENLSLLDTLTGNPLPDDILHFAIPVCAPYASILKYKYKVKLTPGALKKGKAIKQATSFFLSNNPEVTQREKELMKSVPEMDAIAVMLGKVKVSAPNLEASKRSGKKKK